MSTSSGTGYVNQRTGTHRSSLRAQSSSASSAQKPSLKSKTLLRKSSPAALGVGSSSAAAGSKSGNGGDSAGKIK